MENQVYPKSKTGMPVALEIVVHLSQMKAWDHFHPKNSTFSTRQPAKSPQWCRLFFKSSQYKILFSLGILKKSVSCQESLSVGINGSE